MGDIMYIYFMEKTIEQYSRYVFTDCGKVLALDKKGKREIFGAKDKNGYLKITLVRDDNKYFYFRKHRLIMWAFFGKNDLQVNHIDGDVLNNNLNNLEYVNSRENQSHRRKKAGYHVGVCWGKKENKWRAYIQKDKKWFHLGYYIDFNDAKQAYLNKLNELNLINKYA